MKNIGETKFKRLNKADKEKIATFEKNRPALQCLLYQLSAHTKFKDLNADDVIELAEVYLEFGNKLLVPESK